MTAEVTLVNANPRMPRDFNPILPVILNAPLPSLVEAPGLISGKTPIKPSTSLTARVTWALPATLTDNTVVTWRPDGFPRRWLLNGTLPAQDLPPWEVIGINEGEYRCLQFLRNLRGPMLEVTSSDPGVWCAASIDATNHQLTMVAYRASGAGGQVTYSLTSPKGTTFGNGQRETLLVNSAGNIALTSATETASGASHHLTCDLPEDGGIALTLPLTGTWPSTADLILSQVYCTGILQELVPDAHIDLPLRLPADAASAKKAWVQVVVEELGENEGSVEISGQHYVLPSAYSPPNCPMIRRVEIDSACLAGVTHLTFRAAGPAIGNGFLLCAASVIYEK